MSGHDQDTTLTFDGHGVSFWIWRVVGVFVKGGTVHCIYFVRDLKKITDAMNHRKSDFRTLIYLNRIDPSKQMLDWDHFSLKQDVWKLTGQKKLLEMMHAYDLSVMKWTRTCDLSFS